LYKKARLFYQGARLLTGGFTTKSKRKLMQQGGKRKFACSCHNRRHFNWTFLFSVFSAHNQRLRPHDLKKTKGVKRCASTSLESHMPAQLDN